ncbi:MAG TPA: hypothetical protein VHA52_05130 [Candidatus Babeliaceae bacterium]|nr:hypothetical protein [Candidatus Babeliaceae bacterium]
MSTSEIRENLIRYIRVADDKKVTAIYTMVKDGMDTPANDWDERLINELERRSKSISNGTAKTYSWEETKAAAGKRLKSQEK